MRDDLSGSGLVRHKEVVSPDEVPSRALGNIAVPGAMPSEPDAYLTGTHYFRPPNPPRREHRAHLTKIKRKLGFDLIRLRLQWNAIHRKPTHFDWTEYDEIADICEDLQLRFFLETSLESAPYWLDRAHPESRYVSAKGQALELGPYESTQFGGYPGLCFHHRVVQEWGAHYLLELAQHFRQRPMLIGYDCWNEPHLEPAWISLFWGDMGDRLFCYCTESRQAFRRWLERKYGDLQTLNEVWGRAYDEWEAVNPPVRHGTYADWLDWGRFWFDDLAQHMRWRYQTLKRADPSRFVMSHSGAVPPFLPRANAFIHNWKLAAEVDLWGTSYAPKHHNWGMSECAGTMEATRSAMRGRAFWISEMSGGATNLRGFAKIPASSPDEYGVWNWLAAAYGAKATVYWCYLEESTGPEAGGFGLVRANGELTPRARSAGETAAVLRQYSEILAQHLPKPQVGILYDPDNSTQLFAMMNGDDLCSQSHIGYYRAVWRADLYAHYVTCETLDSLSELKVLIVPMCLTLPEQVARRIAEFVRSGGVLIAEARTGLFDQRGYIQPHLPAYGLQEVVGAAEQEAIYSDPENRPPLNNPANEPWPDPLCNGPEIAFAEPCAAMVRARSFLVPLTPQYGRPIAHCLGHCLGVQNRYGQGTAYYVGTYLGLALAQNDQQAMSVVLGLLNRHVSPEISGTNLRPRLIKAGDQALLAIFNDDRKQTHTEVISLPRSYTRAYDVYARQDLTIDGCSLRLTVMPENVCVVHLTSEQRS